MQIALVQHFSQIDGNLWMGGTPAYCNPMPKEFKDFRFIVCLYPWEPYELEEHHVYTQARMFDSYALPEECLVDALADYVTARLHSHGGFAGVSIEHELVRG